MTKIYVTSDLHMGHAEAMVLAALRDLILDSCDACSGQCESEEDRLIRKVLESAEAVKNGAKVLHIDSASSPSDTYLMSLVASLTANFPEVKLIVDGEDLDAEDEPEQLDIDGLLHGLAEGFAELFGGVHDEPFEDEMPDSAYGLDPEAGKEEQAKAIFEDMSEQEGFINSRCVELNTHGGADTEIIGMVAKLIEENFPEKIVLMNSVEDLQDTFDREFSGVNLSEVIGSALAEEREIDSDLTKVEVMRKAIEEDGLSFHEAYELADME